MQDFFAKPTQIGASRHRIATKKYPKKRKEKDGKAFSPKYASAKKMTFISVTILYLESVFFILMKVIPKHNFLS